MVIFSSFSNIVGMVPYSIIYILYRTVTNSALINVLSDLGMVLMYISIDLDIVVYYCFNKLFREVLTDYFKRIQIFFKKAGSN